MRSCISRKKNPEYIYLAQTQTIDSVGINALRRRIDQGLRTDSACRSAWYEERTIGPLATWSKPIDSA